MLVFPVPEQLECVATCVLDSAGVPQHVALMGFRVPVPEAVTQSLTKSSVTPSCLLDPSSLPPLSPSASTPAVPTSSASSTRYFVDTSAVPSSGDTAERATALPLLPPVTPSVLRVPHTWPEQLAASGLRSTESPSEWHGAAPLLDLLPDDAMDSGTTHNPADDCCIWSVAAVECSVDTAVAGGDVDDDGTWHFFDPHAGERSVALDFSSVGDG